MILLIIPNSMKSRYKEIKGQALKYSLNTQLMVSSNLKNYNLRIIATKILLQMLVKVGNTLWVPQIPEALSEKIMLIGLDTSGRRKKVITGVGTASP